MIQIAKELGIAVEEKNISLCEVYTADEAFTTGTMGGLVPVSEVRPPSCRHRRRT